MATNLPAPFSTFRSPSTLPADDNSENNGSQIQQTPFSASNLQSSILGMYGMGQNSSASVFSLGESIQSQQKNGQQMQTQASSYSSSAPMPIPQVFSWPVLRHTAMGKTFMRSKAPISDAKVEKIRYFSDLNSSFHSLPPSLAVPDFGFEISSVHKRCRAGGCFDEPLQQYHYFQA